MNCHICNTDNSLHECSHYNKNTMTKQELEIRMKNHEIAFNALMEQVKTDVIFFADLNPDITQYDFNYYLTTTENFVCNICESGAWIKDRITGNLLKKTSLKKKIRKALGFTQP